jgi:membrane fusion protein (multidrug efflux system)
VIDKNNVVKSRNITVTGELPDLYVVATGLEAGERILLEGIQKAKDDDKIAYEYEKPEDVIYHLRLKAE